MSSEKATPLDSVQGRTPDPSAIKDEDSKSETHVAVSSPVSSKHPDIDDKEDEEDPDPSPSRNASHASSLSPSLESHSPDPHYETGDEIYTRFTPSRKASIVVILCLCSFLSPISSTSILAASPEVVATFQTTGAIFDVSNALYIVGMGLSPLLYGPVGQHCGRQRTLAVSAACFTAFSAGTAAAPNLAAYFVFRLLTALNGTAFFITGGAVIGDLYRSVERGTAYGWFLSGTNLGPALGPVVGGIIVTYAESWRDIFWLQTAMAGVATGCVVLFLPETAHVAPRGWAELKGLRTADKARRVWTWVDPTRVLVVLFTYPNLLVAAFGTSALVWNMYSLLTPIQYVLNPRFHLTTPLQGSLFYLAPGAGYLVGTLVGGRWADVVVRKYIRKRGHRIPEDRLHSCWTSLGVILPACMLIYGWTVEFKVGGIAVPVIAMFVQGVAQTFSFASINTYCIDFMQKRSAEVVAGNYVIRYIFAAAGSAACLPIIDCIGVGWMSTISAAILVVSAFGIWVMTLRGQGWREAVNRKQGQENA